MLAFAAILRERFVVAGGLLAVAALLHPIMAAPGMTVLFVMLCRRDRRWLLLAGAGTLALGAAIGLGLPLARRITEFVDPQWKAILDVRNNYLFPRLWDADDLAMFVLRVATLILAAKATRGRARALFFTAAGVAIGGIVVAELFGDFIPNLLVIQVQPWRAAWISAALAPAALAILIVIARDETPSAWIAPALLALAWAPIGAPARFVVCLLAIAYDPFSQRAHIRLSDPVSRGLTVAIVALGGLAALYHLIVLFSVVIHDPDGILATRSRWLLRNAHSWPLAFLAVSIALGASSARDVRLLAAAAAALCGLASVGWDSRNDYHRFFDAQRPISAFSAIVATRPGEVYWERGANEAWYGLGRPNWLASLQGAGIVFSREETFLWKARAERAVTLGFETRQMVQPFGLETTQGEPTIDARRLHEFCASADAPVWVVWPLTDNEAPPSDLHPLAVWPSPRSFAFVLAKDGAYQWKRTTNFMLLPCRGKAAA
ncbi:hypothetical protein [Rhodoblastus sp.]|uniref:hypothetical protein n=1 Tax=Rhodoblastus sp. TaxID=1962975 RepID=UPI00260A69F8|nr:hypothetical protein [Rhodoblastus sp.]